MIHSATVRRFPEAAQEVRAEAQRITEAAKLQRQSTAPVPLPPRLSVTELLGTR